MRPIEIFSIDLDARAAWVTSGIEGEPIQAMTAGGLVSLCGHFRWMFGCATGHLGIVSISFDEKRFEGRSYTTLEPGFGGRLGGHFNLYGSFSLRLAADVIGVSTRVQVMANDKKLAVQPPVMVGTNLTGVWEF